MPVQEKRAGVLDTPLGKDKLAIVRFDGSEGVNELFEWRLEAVSAEGDIDFDGLIGKHATLTINGVNGRKRKFDGIVTEARWLGVRDHFHAYRLVLRPWLWVLSQRTDNYIFHEMSVTDIIADVFSDYGALAEFDDRTSAAYPPIEYCVQYRESDMAFVTRLMEEFGISYSFVHADGSHKLVMSDQNMQVDTVEGATRKFITLSGQDRRTEECIHHFVPERRFASGKTAWKDYNFKKPTAEMHAQKEGTASYEQAGKELYDWPGRYMELGQGQTFAQIKLEAHEAQDKRCMAAGNSPSLFAGSLMTLTDHPVGARNIEYLVLRSQHTFTSQNYRSGGSGGTDSYEGQYELIDSAIPLRPMKTTPKPVVQGPQTAFVVGAQGEEIDCDEYGRILVRFHWDRENDQSMRCRVAQNWAYKQWGGMIIPRIGMEVMVEFLDGDPDRPLVTGSVYNGDSMPPYSLPANKTKSVFRTQTHKGAGFNELAFEDEKEQEEMYIHAQKDMNVDVLHDRGKTVGHDQSEAIGHDKTITVGNNHTESIGANKTLSVGGSFARTVGRVSTEQVGLLKSTFVGGDQTVMVGLNKVENVGKSLSSSAGENIGFDAGKVFEIKAADTFRVKVGEARFEMDKSGIIVIDAPLTTIAKGAATQLTIGPGPVLYTPALVPGKTPPPPSQCLKKMAAQRVPFIKQG